MQLKIRLSLCCWLALGAAAAITACVSLPPLPTADERAKPGKTRPSCHAAAIMPRRRRPTRGWPPRDRRPSASTCSSRPCASGSPAAAAPTRPAYWRGISASAKHCAEPTSTRLLDAEVSLARQPHRARMAADQCDFVRSDDAGRGAALLHAAGCGSRSRPARPIDGIRAEIAGRALRASAAPRCMQLRSQLLAALLRGARARRAPGCAQPAPIRSVRGWLELGAMAPRSRAAVAGQRCRWRRTGARSYPNHPALDILGQAFPPPLISAAPAAAIALLLPLSGPAAAQACDRARWLSERLLSAAGRGAAGSCTSTIPPRCRWPQALLRRTRSGSTLHRRSADARRCGRGGRRWALSRCRCWR